MSQGYNFCSAELQDPESTRKDGMDWGCKWTKDHLHGANPDPLELQSGLEITTGHPFPTNKPPLEALCGTQDVMPLCGHHSLFRLQTPST